MECATCGSSSSSSRLRRCSACRLVAYCSVTCQKADWKLHKPVCCKPASVALGTSTLSGGAKGPETLSRSDAVDQLCAHLQEAFPDEGFMRHPALRFVEESGDLRGQCAEDLPQGSTLLVVPDEATVSLAAPACLKLPIGGWLMADVLTAVEQAFHRQFPDGLAVLEAHNVSLAVLMMHLALQPATALHKNMAATWPRLHALHGSLPLTYADTVLELFSGTTVSDAIRAVRADANAAFTHAVSPVLSATADGGGCLSRFFTAEALPLRDAFLHALSLCLSRTHEDNAAHLPDAVGKLTAVADCFNGVPDGHPAVNIELRRGQWGAIRGAAHRTESTLACTAVRLTRAVKAGEQLLCLLLALKSPPARKPPPARKLPHARKVATADRDPERVAFLWPTCTPASDAWCHRWLR